MKLIACLLVSLAFAVSSLQADDRTSVSDLASGYASAVHCMDKLTVSIVYSGASQVETIKDVKDVRAFGGVLLIKDYKGYSSVLDASRVIKIVEDGQAL